MSWNASPGFNSGVVQLLNGISHNGIRPRRIGVIGELRALSRFVVFKHDRSPWRFGEELLTHHLLSVLEIAVDSLVENKNPT